VQKGPGSEQLARRPGLAVDLGAELSDMADTAAVLRCLDLVISVDTAVAHLAGALGGLVWVALSYAPDWRWLMNREDSPWYPTMRLFRQNRFGDWSNVFERIEAELKLRIEACRMCR
jgi:ADP-heptose:LPS heptosyltransferase